MVEEAMLRDALSIAVASLLSEAPFRLQHRKDTQTLWGLSWHGTELIGTRWIGMKLHGEFRKWRNVWYQEICENICIFFPILWCDWGGYHWGMIFGFESRAFLRWRVVCLFVFLDFLKKRHWFSFLGFFDHAGRGICCWSWCRAYLQHVPADGR